MKLRELMTTDVITIAPDAPLKEAARRMIEAKVSGLPVTDAGGALIGIITEADFVKEEAGRRSEQRAGLLRWLHRDDVHHGERRVADVMTKEVVTLTEDDEHIDAARLMNREGVKRLPIVSADGVLVGLISRRDILRVFARPDAEIIGELSDHVVRKVLWIDARRLAIGCQDGNVTLTGRLETRSDAQLLVELARRLDGVVSVADHLTWDIDNTKLEMVSPPMAGPRW
jgi:CBS-domain-containing membrane protein